MRKSPNKMSKSPVRLPVQHDPLSDFIDQLRVSASVHGVFELSAPFALHFGPRPEIDVSLLSIVRGTAAVTAEGVQATLSAGDLLLRAGSGALALKDAADSRAQVQHIAECPKLAEREPRAGGGGAQTRFVGVGFRISPLSRQALLAQLPPILVTSGEDSPTLASAANLFRAEAASPQGGSRAVLARLGEVIFIDILRRAGTRQEGRCGELRALGDPPLARALALVHAEPATDWTLESLGRAAGLSRSAFAARFLAKVGEPPLHYVARWRMRRAAQLLLDSDAALGDVALQVGYRSEASFSRAFARVMGGTPGVFRRQQRQQRT
jgi:AraC-like DNA-binding protein